MRPSATQIINGIKWSFETQIAPRLDDKQSQSTARSILSLLDHLYVRVASEGQLLSEDNQDKKALFRELLNVLEPTRAATVAAGLAAALTDMNEKLVKEYRTATAYPTVASLTEESEDLKRTLIRTIHALQTHKGDLPPRIYAQADQAIRDQLTRQLDRENALVLPFAGKRAY